AWFERLRSGSRTPPPNGGSMRVRSMRARDSIFSTSAPRKPRVWPTTGPAHTQPKFATRMPSRGSARGISDHAAGAQPVELVGARPEEPAVDLGVVLPERRRRPPRSPGARREPERRAEIAE